MKIGGYGFYDPMNTAGASRSRSYDVLNDTDRVREIKEVDMKQVFRDMEKDRSLARYQYFVGGSPVIDISEDGIVLQK